MGFFDNLALLFGGSKSKELHNELIKEYPPRVGKEADLCFGAMLIYPNPARTLAMRKNENPDKMVQWVLKPNWGIVDTRSAKEQLDALANLTASSRIDFSTYLTKDIVSVFEEFAKGNTPPNGSEVLEKFYTFAPNRAMMYATASLGKKKIGCTFLDFAHLETLAAWDIERLGGLARQCYFANFITEDECYEYLDKAKQLAKEARYKNWKEYVMGYFIGRAFLYNGESDSFDQWESTAGDLLNDEDSIWKSYSLENIN